MRNLVALPLLGLAVILQSAVISHVELLAGYGDLVLVMLAAWALQSQVDSAWQWAFLATIMVGFLTRLPWPVVALGYFAVIAMAYALRQRVWQALTDSVEFGHWFGITLDGPFQVGKTVRGKHPVPGKGHILVEYTVEKIEPQTLFSTLRKVVEGEAPMSGIMATKLLAEFSRQTRRTSQPPTPVATLTEREKEVLHHIAHGKTNKDIAAALQAAEDALYSDFDGPVTVADPLLGPLANNGGPTQTHALVVGSPAIDRGNPNGCLDSTGAPLQTDQRGLPRAFDGNGDGRAACDIGAFEYMVRAFLPLILK